MKVALLTGAKHNSIRLPGKNYKKLHGKELCRYTFEFVTQLKLPYYLFTDSDLLISIAKEYGIETIKSNKIGKGIEEVRWVCEQIKADKYFNFSIPSPIRNMENIRQNMNICLDSKIQSAYSVNLFNLINPKPTGSMFFFDKKQLELNDIRDSNSICLPDWFDFDIDTQEDFDRVENYLKDNE